MLNGGPLLVYAYRETSDQIHYVPPESTIFKFGVEFQMFFPNVRNIVPYQSGKYEVCTRSHSPNLFDVETFRLPHDETPPRGQRKNQRHHPEVEGYPSFRPKGALGDHVEGGLTRSFDFGEGKIKNCDYPKVGPPFRPWMTALVIGGDSRILKTLIGIRNTKPLHNKTSVASLRKKQESGGGKSVNRSAAKNQSSSRGSKFRAKPIFACFGDITEAYVYFLYCNSFRTLRRREGRKNNFIVTAVGEQAEEALALKTQFLPRWCFSVETTPAQSAGDAVAPAWLDSWSLV